MSTEIMTGQNAMTGLAQPATGTVITTYWTASSMSFRTNEPTHDVPYFAMQSGELKLGTGVLADGIMTIGIADTGVSINVPVGTTFLQDVNSNGTFTAIGRVIAQSNASDSVIGYGGMLCATGILVNNGGLAVAKSVSISNSAMIYAYSVYGTPTTTPPGVTGAVQLIVEVNGGNLELRALGPTGATELLATLAAS